MGQLPQLQNYTVKTQQLLQPIVLVTVVPVTVSTTSRMQQVILYWMYVEVEVVPFSQGCIQCV